MSALLLLLVILGPVLAGALLFLPARVKYCHVFGAAGACALSTLGSVALLGGVLGHLPLVVGILTLGDLAPGLTFSLGPHVFGLVLTAACGAAATTAAASLAHYSRLSLPSFSARETGLALWVLSAASALFLANTVTTVYLVWLFSTTVTVALVLAAGEHRWAARLAVAGVVSSFALLGVYAAIAVSPFTGGSAPVSVIPLLGWPIVAAFVTCLVLGSWGLPLAPYRTRQRETAEGRGKWEWLSFASVGPGLYLCASALYDGPGAWASWQAPVLVFALLLAAAGGLEQVLANDLWSWLRGVRRSEVSFALAGLAVGHPIGLVAMLVGLVNLTLSGSAASFGLHAFHQRRREQDSLAQGSISQCLPLGFAALSLAGVPPLLGFASRLLLLVGSLEAGLLWVALPAMCLMTLSPLSLVGRLRQCHRLATTEENGTTIASSVGSAITPLVLTAMGISLALLSPATISLVNPLLEKSGSATVSLGQSYTLAWLTLVSATGAALASGVTGAGEWLGHHSRFVVNQWRRRLLLVLGGVGSHSVCPQSVWDLSGTLRQFEERHYLTASLLTSTVVIAYCLGF